ncbi:MAG TPA: hypothetical protein VGC63_07380 [Solirubrobacterales bacterium]
MAIRQRLVPEVEVLAAIVELADDGFCLRRELFARFPGRAERTLQRSVARTARHGLVLERRGPDGASYLALTSEGWKVLRG